MMSRLLNTLFITAAAAAQAAPQTVPASPAGTAGPVVSSPATPAEAANNDYKVGPQDLLNITVFGESGLSGKFRVDGDGSFSFQYLGRVKADGLSVTEIAEVLRKRLADGYLRNPQVSVEIEQYHSQNVYVLGEVRAPNKYSL